jgi:hypothetical protein
MRKQILRPCMDWHHGRGHRSNFENCREVESRERGIASFLLEQHPAASGDDLLHCLRKSVQQPGQRHFQLHVILSHLHVSCCYLSEGADAETQPVTRPVSSSTASTGKLQEALPNAGFTRRKASSLPSVCGILTTSGSAIDRTNLKNPISSRARLGRTR